MENLNLFEILPKIEQLEDIEGFSKSLKNVQILFTKLVEETKHLEKVKESLSKAQQLAHIGHWELDLSNNTLTWSDEIYRIFGLQPQQFSATYEEFMFYVHPEDRDAVNNAYNTSVQTNTPYEIIHRVVRPDGEIRFVEERCEHAIDKEGNIITSIGTVHDITETVKTQKELESYIEIIDQNIISSKTDLNGTITYTSEAFCLISGYTKEELLGKNHRIVRHPDMPSSLYDLLWETITSGKTWKGEIKNQKKDGTCYWVQASISPLFDEMKKHIGYTAIRQDITDKKRIEEISITDELTGLYNRRYFNNVINVEINHARRDGKILCFIIMDVDHFKKYNDTYGHQEGDTVLKSIGALFHSELKRSSDIPFRLGGEEFGVLYSVTTDEDALRVANLLCQQLEAKKMEHANNTASPYVTASFGLVTIDFMAYPHFDVDVDFLYKAADDCLYEAKEQGRNRVISKKIS